MNIYSYFIMKIDIIKYIENFVNFNYPKKYNFSYRTQKYSLSTIISELFYMLKSGVSYRDYRGPIKRSTLYFHLKFFRDNEIFQKIYISLLLIYFKKNKMGKLKYQIIDSSFIQNINGIDCIGRNKYFKNKKGTKISFIIDDKKIPISIVLDKGNVNDGQFIEKHLQNMLIDTNTKKFVNNNRYKQYFLGDKGYDSQKIRNILSEKGYIPLIDYNKRNTRDPKKIKKLNKKDKIKYKKRIKVENIFCYLKKNKRIRLREEKYCKSYLSFIYMGLIKFLLNKIVD